MKTKISVEVDEVTLAFLQVLATSDAMGGKGSPAEVVSYLIHCATDGVRRPGSWERGWVRQAFGDGREDRLEQDPEVHYYQRPRRGTR